MIPRDDNGNVSIAIRAGTIEALLDHIKQRGVQAHGHHSHWNEGAGDFKECIREDCREVRGLLEPWEWL